MDIRVSVSPGDAVRLIEDGIIRGNISGTLCDRYVAGDVCVMVFEKYFMRTSSRASLTVTVHPTGDGATHVHSVGSGGGQGALFRFDWGAGESFENSVMQSLGPYIVR